MNTYPNCSGWSNPDQSLFDGISGERSEVRVAQISDGTGNTFFAGEKYMNPQKYYTGDNGADNNSMLQGNDWDVNRWVRVDGVFSYNPPDVTSPSPSNIVMPMRDTPGVGTCASGFGMPIPPAASSYSATARHG